MKRAEIFPQIEPPPGGLAGLRARMDSRPRVIGRRARVSFALAMAAVVLLFFFIRSRGAPDTVTIARQHDDASEIALGLAPMPAATVAIDESDRATTALTLVPTSNPNVSFYWVSSTSWQE